ncbi:MAG: hypothetical protein E7Z88_07285 [Cyanobacteria bacterium SIG27]|nr:hypothetical protein [Cyanobacteria bacterium SIG27]
MNLKKAFSMVELILIITLIGFIIIAELTILNNKMNEYGQPYFTAYNALKKASYNVLADMYCPGEACPVKDLKAPRKFPKTSEELCERLSEFINTAGKVENMHCAATEGYEDINIMADNFDEQHDKPRMIASNSYRFYFTSDTSSGGSKPLRISGIKDVYGHEYNVDYFIVWIDLNGEKEPNRITCNNSKLYPDIVPFAVTTRGEVIPMGFPIYNTLYLTAKIKYPTKIETEEQPDGTKKEVFDNESSASTSFYKAIYGAWPTKNDPNKNVQENIDIPFSILFTDRMPEKSLIHQCYSEESAIEFGLKSKAQFHDELIDRSDMGCTGGTYACRVIVDSTIETRF